MATTYKSTPIKDFFLSLVHRFFGKKEIAVPYGSYKIEIKSAYIAI